MDKFGFEIKDNMFKRLAQVVILGVLLCMCIFLAACTASKGTIRIGVRGDIPDFGYQIEGSGRFYGYEIDLAKEVAKRLGYSNVEFVRLDIDERDKALSDGDIDLLMACYSYSLERSAKFHLSDPYFKNYILWISEKSSQIEDYDEIYNAKVGVLKGSATADIVRNVYTRYPNQKIRVIDIDSYDAIMENLDAGTIDMAAMELVIYYQYRDIYNHDCFGDDEYNSYICAATRKGDSLGEEVDRVLEEIDADGTNDELYDKWYGGGTTYELED